jgi:hypothetical protein
VEFLTSASSAMMRGSERPSFSSALPEDASLCTRICTHFYQRTHRYICRHRHRITYTITARATATPQRSTAISMSSFLPLLRARTVGLARGDHLALAVPGRFAETDLLRGGRGRRGTRLRTEDGRARQVQDASPQLFQYLLRLRKQVGGKRRTCRSTSHALEGWNAYFVAESLACKEGQQITLGHTHREREKETSR